LFGSTPSGPEPPSDRTTIVGTPSSPVTRKRRRGVGVEAASVEVEVSLSGAAVSAAPARESSSELRLNSCGKCDRGAYAPLADPPNPDAPCHDKPIDFVRGRPNRPDSPDAGAEPNPRCTSVEEDASTRFEVSQRILGQPPRNTRGNWVTGFFGSVACPLRRHPP
jgi:hypothetical protein